MSRCTENCRKPTPFQAHCSNEETMLFHLSLRDGDPLLGPSFYTEPANGSPDPSRVSVEKFAYLRSTQSGFVKPSSFRYPVGTVDSVVLPRRDRHEVLFTVVSSVPVTVVNVIFSSDPLFDDSMFIGLDVATQTDPPPETYVPVSGKISARRIARYLLTGKKLTNQAGAISALLAGSAVPLLGGSSDPSSTVSARFSHEAILQVKTLCHRTFGGVTGFDQHRSNGNCLNPASFEYVERDGVWRRPVDHEEVQAFKDRVRGTR